MPYASHSLMVQHSLSCIGCYTYLWANRVFAYDVYSVCACASFVRVRLHHVCVRNAGCVRHDLRILLCFVAYSLRQRVKRVVYMYEQFMQKPEQEIQ